MFMYSSTSPAGVSLPLSASNQFDWPNWDSPYRDSWCNQL